MKWYIGNRKNGRGLVIICIGTLIASIFFLFTAKMISQDSNILGLTTVLVISVMIIDVLLMLMLLANVYSVNDDVISFFCGFKLIGTIKISDIKTVIIANNKYVGTSIYTEKITNSKNRRVCLPYVSLNMYRNEKIIGKQYDHPMTNYDINMLISENAKSDESFGFLFNKEITDNFLKHYKGEVYIARTVYENFSESIADIYEKWEFSGKKIIIIYDRNLKGDICNSYSLK